MEKRIFLLEDMSIVIVEDSKEYKSGDLIEGILQDENGKKIVKKGIVKYEL